MCMELVGFERSVKRPIAVRRIEVVGRDEHRISTSLCSSKYALDILHGVVFRDAGANRIPVLSRLTQHVVLWVDDHHGGVVCSERHDLRLSCGCGTAEGPGGRCADPGE